MLDLVVLFEHPEWQKPLFAALERRNINFGTFDLKAAAFDVDLVPEATVYFNQASPSAYVRGNTRAVPLALSLMRCLELAGALVLNGAAAFSVEISKSAQGALMQKLGIDHPASLAFNEVSAVRGRWSRWPALLKPEQGGSGARMFLLRSYEELERTLALTPRLWMPDNLLLLQEYLPADTGIVRIEIVGGELLYAMRVVSHGSFNLCPSEVCNPEDGEGTCDVPNERPTKPVEFHPLHDLPGDALETAKRIASAAHLDVGGIEYLEHGSRRVFFDVNANSNLRPAIGRAFGFDPFERVVDFLERSIAHAKAASGVSC